jgi:hypothetical protein
MAPTASWRFRGRWVQEQGLLKSIDAKRRRAEAQRLEFVARFACYWLTPSIARIRKLEATLLPSFFSRSA